MPTLMRTVSRSLGDVQVHPWRWAELGLDLAIHDEANSLVEANSVVVRRHLDPTVCAAAGALDQVMDEDAADSLAHPVWIDKQILDLDHVVAVERRGETDECAVGNRDASTSLSDTGVSELQHLRIGQQGLPVALTGEG